MLWFFLTLLIISPSVLAQLQLPTPRSSYETYDPQVEAAQLAAEVAQELNPAQRMQAMGFFATLQQGEPESLTLPEISEFLKTLDWEKRRARILRLMIYQSGILEAFSEGSKSWLPFVHDFLLFFLDRLPEDRLVDRIVAQLRIPAEDQGARLIALADRAPSLQKIGQIMARHPSLPEDIRQTLQTFENSIRTSRRGELVDFITSDLGSDTVSRYQMQFDPEVLAEASVGAVIKVGLTFPEDGSSKTAVCKVLKTYAVANLREELVILEELVRYFEDNGDFYQLGQIPLSQMFQEARDVLSREILVLEEQKNLARAVEYYQGDPKVKVPEMYSMSTPNVTFMEFIEGGKIVDFPGDDKGRTRLAKRLDEVMTWDVIFSRQEEAIFHGDPHAGNVFYLEDEPGRIALLDWGLSGSLPRNQREQLIQLLLGVYLKDKKRVRNNVDVVLQGGFQDSPEERAKIQEIALNVIEKAQPKEKGKEKNKDQFLVLNDMIIRLTQAGYSLNFNLVLFIKAQVTIAGILKELDPDLNRSKRAVSIIGGQILKESPKRLLNTVYFPGWTSHGYPSMVSNEDIRDVEFKMMGQGFKKLGVWTWKGFTFQIPPSKPDVEAAAEAESADQ